MNRDVIFDLDGTLVDSSRDIIDCLRKAYEECGVALSGREITRACIGPPLPEMISRVTPGIIAAQLDAIVNAFRRCYDRSLYGRTEVYEGIWEMLCVLRAHGIRLFIATNKPRLPTLRLLGLFFGDFFTDVVTPDNGMETFFSKAEMLLYLKAKWEMRRSYFIGDSPQDIIAARETNMESIAVLYGYGKKDELQAQNPFFTAADANQIVYFILQGGRSCEF